MADSFADLWNSSAPTKPTQPQKLGSIAQQNTNTNLRRPHNDAFSMLASSGQSSSRVQSPVVVIPTQPNRLAQANQAATSARNNGDAFSGLLSGSLGKGLGNGTNMTIAERAAMVDKARSQQYQQSMNAMRARKPSQSSPWAGLDQLGSSNAQSVQNYGNNGLEDDWGLEFSSVQKGNTKHSATSSAAPADDDWGLDEFVSPKPTTKPTPARAQTTQSLWDLDDFGSPSAPAQKPASRTDSLGDFDFGDREDRLLDNDSDNEDDILGDLSRPITNNASSANRSNRATPSPRPPISRQSSPRPVSPPPHIIGQIVEMGFSPQQARVALATTDTGVDVQAALETLLANGATSEPSPPPPSRRRPPPNRERGIDDPPDSRRQHNARSQPRPSTRAQHSRETPSPSGSQQEGDLKEQADKIIAQASEIGLNMFNRANAFWKESKEKAQKLYEERAAATRGAGSSSQAQDGRPRWMQEASFRDDEDKDSGRRDHEAAVDVLPSKPPRRPAVEPSRPPQREGDLLSVDSPAVYKSPFRRGKPKAEAPSPNPASTPARAPSPIQLTQRLTISASPSATAASSRHKATGTEKYKLGQYADAETAYSAAITAIPDSHLLLIPLHNNRALARLKTGNYTAAVEDCTTVINIIGASYHPAREEKVTREDHGSSVDLADGLVKAWKRRAEAYEGREKWELAQKDWEAVASAEWAAANVRNEAVRGAGRCRRMSSSGGEMGATPMPTKPKPRPPPVAKKPASLAQRPPSEALNKLREATDAADAEDQARHDLKDVVDGRLNAWKGGKETNIRALIASLDNVLWPELGWQKVSMADLVTPSQVKIRYTKAIAKLHPDKLNANNTTLEQRMIANGVFGALNEAWNVFKQ